MLRYQQYQGRSIRQIRDAGTDKTGTTGPKGNLVARVFSPVSLYESTRRPPWYC